jgi:hypothetical protein
MDRRRFLAATSAGVGAALAGCTEGLGELGGGSGGSGGLGGNSLPEYHTGLPAETAGGGRTEFLHVDVEELIELGLFETPTATETPTPTPESQEDDPATPLLASPIVGSLFALILGFGLGVGGFGRLGERFSNITETGADSDVATVTFVADTVVIRGSFDTDLYTNDLPDSFGEAKTRGGFAVYEESDEEPLAVAISDEVIVLSFVNDENSVTGPEAVAHVIDAETGDVERLADRSPDDDWVLRTAGSHTFVLGSGQDTEYEAGDNTFDPLAGTPLADTDTSLLVSGATIDSFDEQGSSASSDLALTHASSPVERSEIADVYVDSEADVSVSVSKADRDGAQRVNISADFSDRSLGL